MRLRQAGLTVEPQFFIPEIGVVDLRVGDRVLMEVDGREHHAQVQGFERDRWRDREAQRRGFIPLRFSHLDVEQRWEAVEASVLDFVRSDRHRDRRRPSPLRVSQALSASEGVFPSDRARA